MGSLLAQIGKEIDKNVKHRTAEGTIANILTQAIISLKEARGVPPAAGKQINLPLGSLESLAAPKPVGKRVWSCTAADDCMKECLFGWSILQPIVCEDHQEEGMDKYVPKRRCGQGRVCPKQPTFGWHGKSAVACKVHADPDMVNTVSKLCGAGHHEPCVKRPTYGWPGTNKALRCKEHAEAGMRDVAHSWCCEPLCDKRGKYAFPNSSSIRAGRCENHVLPGMEDFTSKRCTIRGCINMPASLQAGAKRRCPEHEHLPSGRGKKARLDMEHDEDMPLRPGGSFVAAMGGYGVVQQAERGPSDGVHTAEHEQQLHRLAPGLVASST